MLQLKILSHNAKIKDPVCHSQISKINTCFSITQSCPTLCDPMDCSMPGFPVLHHLPEFAQTHVCRVGDVIQQSHPLSSPSLPVFSLSQHRGLFQRVGFWPESALNSLQYIPNDVKVFLPTGAKVTCRLCLE